MDGFQNYLFISKKQVAYLATFLSFPKSLWMIGKTLGDTQERIPSLRIQAKHTQDSNGSGWFGLWMGCAAITVSGQMYWEKLGHFDPFLWLACAESRAAVNLSWGVPCTSKEISRRNQKLYSKLSDQYIFFPHGTCHPGLQHLEATLLKGYVQDEYPNRDCQTLKEATPWETDSAPKGPSPRKQHSWSKQDWIFQEMNRNP